MGDDYLSNLLQTYDYLTRRESADHPAVNCPIERWIELATQLKDDQGFDLLMDATCIDWHLESPRFTAIYHLLSSNTIQYIRIAVDIPDDESPRIPSVTGIWAAANWHEREVYDMF